MAVKVLYVVPGIMSKTDLGAEELERRKGFLQERAGKDVLVDITDVEHGPTSPTAKRPIRFPQSWRIRND